MSTDCPQTEVEHKRLYEVLNFRLPHQYKTIGLAVAAGLLLFLVLYKFLGSNTTLVKDGLRSILLLALLIASLSKDKLEDEYNRAIRFQSFVIGFVAAATYAIVIPLIALILDVLIVYVSQDGEASFYEVSAFEIIFMMLGMQLLTFATLKRFGRA